MSFDAVSWAWKVPVKTPIERCVLMILCQWADPNGACFANQSTVAEFAMCDLRSVGRAIVSMEAQGLLNRVAAVMAIDHAKAIPGSKPLERQFIAWAKNAHKGSKCYFMNVGFFPKKGGKVSWVLAGQKVDTESQIEKRAAEDPPLADTVSGKGGHSVRRTNESKNISTNGAEDAAEAPAGGDAPEGTPPACAHFKDKFADLHDGFLSRVFEKTIDALTVISDENNVMIFGAADNEILRRAEALRPKLAEILGRSIEFEITPWADAAYRYRRARRWAKGLSPTGRTVGRAPSIRNPPPPAPEAEAGE